MPVMHFAFAVDGDGIVCVAPMTRPHTDVLNRVTCARCLGTRLYHLASDQAEREEYEHDNEDYLRAAAGYDGEGRDWR